MKLRWICIFVLLFSVFLMLPSNVQPDHQSLSTTYWHLEKDHNDVWWLVNPAGQKDFILGVTTVIPIQKAILGKDYISEDFNGDIDLWARVTSEKIKKIGFKTIGAWSNPAIYPYLPYTKDLNLSNWAHVSINDPRWEANIEQAVKAQVKPQDKNLIGYYLDNELKWTDMLGDAEKYFNVTSRLVRKYDPNHLILGVRFNKPPPQSVLSASIGKVDVHSFNQYTDGVLYRKMMSETYRICKTPIIISEFSFFAENNNSGNTNTFKDGKNPFWGGKVSTQQDRVVLFNQYVNGAVNCSYILGVEWFQYTDEPSEGREDGENYNFGIMDNRDRPYKEMTEVIKQQSKTLNDKHKQANNSQPSPVWVEDVLQ